MSDVSITPNTDDPRGARLLEDGVDIDHPDFDAEADEKARRERQEARQAEIDENSTTTATEKAAGKEEPKAEEPKEAPAKADISSKPKTGSVPVQSSGDTPAK